MGYCNLKTDGRTTTDVTVCHDEQNLCLNIDVQRVIPVGNCNLKADSKNNVDAWILVVVYCIIIRGFGVTCIYGIRVRNSLQTLGSGSLGF